MKRSRFKIAFPLLSLGTFGGVRKLLELANGLVDFGHEVFLLYPEGRGHTPFRIREEVRRITVPGRNRLLALLRYALAVGKYDVAVLNFWPTAYLFPLTRRAIYFVQDLEYRFHSNPILRFLASLTYRFPVPIVTYNPALARAVDAEYVIPAGVDRGAFYPDPDPSLKTEGRLAVMYMPRKERRKGAHIFRKAVERIKGCCDFEVWLVGGPENVPGTLPVPTRRFHPKGDRELRRLYSSADLFVLTSESEGLGFPVMEALSCGTPVVATDVDGKEVWSLPGVEVVEVSPEAVAEAMVRVLGSINVWQERALDGREGIPDVRDMVESFHNVLIAHFSTL